MNRFRSVWGESRGSVVIDGVLSSWHLLILDDYTREFEVVFSIPTTPKAGFVWTSDGFWYVKVRRYEYQSNVGVDIHAPGMNLSDQSVYRWLSIVKSIEEEATFNANLNRMKQ
jgi:hypothetical protein